MDYYLLHPTRILSYHIQQRSNTGIRPNARQHSSLLDNNVDIIQHHQQHFNNIRTCDGIIGGNPKGNAPGSATHSRLISVPQRQASRVNIPHDNAAMDHRLPTLRNSWNRTFSACDKCGFGHLNGTCPAYNKVCYQCNRFGHFAKQCTSKTKTKTSKRRLRDQERIQKFHNRVMLFKELPFRNIRNAAFLHCMNFNDALKTELTETRAKLQKNIELCKAFAEESKHQNEIAQQKNSDLEEKVLKLQNKLSAVQLNDNKIQELEQQLRKTESEKSTLNHQVTDLQNRLISSRENNTEIETMRNKIISLEKEIENGKMCFREINSRLNADLAQCEKEKQQYIQQLASEMEEKETHNQLHINNRKYILELEQALQSISPSQYQWNGVPQNSWSNGPVPTYENAQQSDPFPCQPVDTTPQQPPPPLNRRRRGRRQHRGWFY